MNEPIDGLPLAAQLRAAARELQAQQPPADLLARIRASVQQRARHARRPPHWAWTGFATAGIAVLAWMLLIGGESAVGDAASASWAGPFVPVAGSEQWRAASESGGDPAWLISVELSRGRLAALGLPYDPARAGESVRAQLLMHSSGNVLAVRVIH
jgi:hypothetical protein